MKIATVWYDITWIFRCDVDIWYSNTVVVAVVVVVVGGDVGDVGGVGGVLVLCYVVDEICQFWDAAHHTLSPSLLLFHVGINIINIIIVT